jgi:ribulose-phosphate 3-epimerase
VEASPHINRTLNHIKELGMKAGIAINPGTSLSVLDAALPDADYVLIMSVNPGFGGQKFIPEATYRVRQLKEIIGDAPTLIEIDGGIKPENIGEVVNAGADVIVVGTGVFSPPGKGDYTKNIQRLRAAGAGK